MITPAHPAPCFSSRVGKVSTSGRAEDFFRREGVGFVPLSQTRFAEFLTRQEFEASRNPRRRGWLLVACCSSPLRDETPLRADKQLPLGLLRLECFGTSEMAPPFWRNGLLFPAMHRLLASVHLRRTRTSNMGEVALQLHRADARWKYGRGCLSPAAGFTPKVLWRQVGYCCANFLPGVDSRRGR